MVPRANAKGALVGPPVLCSRIAGNRKNGRVFSDDGDVYRCPKCRVFHDEYSGIMAKIDADRKALNE
jgi:hypothetical protein